MLISRIMTSAPNPTATDPNRVGGLAPGNVYSGASVLNPDGTAANLVASGTSTTNQSGQQVIYGPSFAGLTYTDADGGTVDSGTNTLTFTNAYETTTALGIGQGGDDSYAPTPLGAQPVDGGTIDGYWQVKGVYYLFRIGPMIRVPIGKNFSASVSAGYIAAWAGSKMRFSETLVIPGITTKAMAVQDPRTPYVSTTSGIQANMVSDVSKYNQKFLQGMYVDANFEWWISTRTGFYAGLVFEKLSSYSQQYAGRVATIKMDDGIGFHFGIITRF